MLLLLSSCLLFMLAGPTLILLNHRILHDYDFPFPIALSALGVICSAVACRSLVWSGAVRPSHPELINSPSFFRQTALPLAVLSALTLALGNSAYVYLSVATCQILKALTPAMTLAVLYLLRVEQPSMMVVMCVLSICLGTFMASRGELALSGIGFGLQLGANLAEACRVVLSQRLLSQLQLPLVEMQYHVAPWQALSLCVASLVVEMPVASQRAAAMAVLAASPAPFVTASLLGLGLQVATLLVIKFAGSVTMKLLAIFRNAVLVLFQVSIGAEQISSLQFIGHAISTSSFVAYTFARMKIAWQEKREAKSKTT
uniref:Sugar phosphate transporter domain-containing protein n=1 Tax=Chrysotila carterae TaxID=13221 RepID=A0A6S9Q582_CHRCT